MSCVKQVVYRHFFKCKTLIHVADCTFKYMYMQQVKQTQTLYLRLLKEMARTSSLHPQDRVGTPIRLKLSVVSLSVIPILCLLLNRTRKELKMIKQLLNFCHNYSLQNTRIIIKDQNELCNWYSIISMGYSNIFKYLN